MNVDFVRCAEHDRRHAVQEESYILELFVDNAEKPDDVFEASTPFGPFVVGNMFETLDHGKKPIAEVRINLSKHNGRITQKQSVWIGEPPRA